MLSLNLAYFYIFNFFLYNSIFVYDLYYFSPALLDPKVHTSL